MLRRNRPGTIPFSEYGPLHVEEPKSRSIIRYQVTLEEIANDLGLIEKPSESPKHEYGPLRIIWFREVIDGAEEEYFVVRDEILSGIKSTHLIFGPFLSKQDAENAIRANETDIPVAETGSNSFDGLAEFDDGALIAKAHGSADGVLFASLWSGDAAIQGNNHPAADLALCDKLAFWTGCDSGRMDRLFRQSGLYREKWYKPHGSDGKTYGERTIQKAISRCTKVNSTRRSTRPSHNPG
jgi:hypothetical protein